MSGTFAGSQLVKAVWTLKADSLSPAEGFPLAFSYLYHDRRLLFNFLFLCSLTYPPDLHNDSVLLSD